MHSAWPDRASVGSVLRSLRGSARLVALLGAMQRFPMRDGHLVQLVDPGSTGTLRTHLSDFGFSGLPSLAHAPEHTIRS
jgi:hypothetical protein